MISKPAIHSEQSVWEYRVLEAQVDEQTRVQQREIDRRIQRYRGGRELLSLKGQTVILVDDGIATGAAFFASLGALLTAETVPVAPPRVVATQRTERERAVLQECAALEHPRGVCLTRDVSLRHL